MEALRRHHVTSSGVPDGPLMLFAHGFGCDQHMWRAVAPSYTDRYRVVTFDYVGSGGSDLTAYDADRYADLEGYADDVVEIIDALNAGPAVFVGHSVSSMVGALVAARAPHLIDRLVMVSPSARYVDDPDDGYVGGFSDADIDDLLVSIESNYLGWSRQMAPVIMGNGDRSELGAELTESFCRTDPAVARQFAEVTFTSDNRADLAAVRCPTLVLQCRSDALAPVSAGRYVHEHLPDSTFVLLDATGHCPHLSAPDETRAAIDAYLW